MKTSTTRENYRKYLNSKDWKRRSADLAIALGERCYRCGRYDGLHVHHLRYRDAGGSVLGRETTNDVVLLCAPHHRDVHAKKFKIGKPEVIPVGFLYNPSGWHRKRRDDKKKKENKVLPKGAIWETFEHKPKRLLK